MVLGHIVPLVGGPWLPVVAKLFLSYAAAEPVEFHIHGLESFDCNIFVDNP